MLEKQLIQMGADTVSSKKSDKKTVPGQSASPDWLMYWTVGQQGKEWIRNPASINSATKKKTFEEATQNFDET